MSHISSWIFLIIIIGFIGVIVSIYFQQNLAKDLLEKGYKWSNRSVTGNLLSNPEGRLWVWYLLSGSWRKITDKSLKYRCVRWTIFQGLALLVFIFFVVIMYFTAVPLTGK